MLKRSNYSQITCFSENPQMFVDGADRFDINQVNDHNFI